MIIKTKLTDLKTGCWRKSRAWVQLLLHCSSAGEGFLEQMPRKKGTVGRLKVIVLLYFQKVSTWAKDVARNFNIPVILKNDFGLPRLIRFGKTMKEDCEITDYDNTGPGKKGLCMTSH